VEGAGFEPSVPLEVITVGIVPCPRTFPRFPPENEVRRGLSAGGGSQERTRLCQAPIPCYTGKIPGISSILASITPMGRLSTHYNQSLRGKFPTQRNRELIMPYQRIKSPQQGNLEVFRQISEGWLWLAFLALTGEKIDQGVPS